MKRKYILLIVAVLLVALVLCRRQISSFFAQQGIDWAGRVIDSRETVTFRSDWVDSLYAKKRYAYFLFTKGVGRGADDIVRSLPQDSVLAVKPVGLPACSPDEPFDTLSLPLSVLELMVRKDAPAALFRVLSVEQDSVGTFYRLKRLPVRE